MSREKMDKSLRESNERYRLLLDRALEGIWFTVYEEPIDITLPEMEIARLVNETGVIAEANNTVAKGRGFDQASQLIGRHWSEFISFEENEEFYLKFVRSNYNIRGDTSVETDREGNICYAENSLVGNIVDGKLVSSFGVGRDITQRIQAEEKYKITFEHTGTAMAVIEEDTTISLVNHQFELQSGYSRKEIEGKKSWAELIHPEDRERMKEAHRRRREPGEETFSQYEFRFVGREGSIKHIFLTIDNIPGTKQSIASLMDITERKRREAEVRREKERSEAYLNIAGVMLAIIDADENISLINNKGCEILGYKAEELIGRNWFDTLVPQRIRAEIRGIFGKLMTGDIEPVEHYENALLTRDGEEKLIAFHNTVIRNPGGEISGILLSGEDITERKKAEERLEHLSRILRAIRNVNQLITKEKDREKLLNGACDNLVETHGYFNAWIALLDESGKLTAHAESGLGEDFLPVIERLKRGQLLTCMLRALKQVEVVATEDPVSACTDCPLSGSYAGRSAATARLEHGGKVYGLLTVSAPREVATDVEELGLFREVAADIAFALYNIEVKEKRKQAEEELRSSEERLSTIFEYAPDALYLNNLKGNFIEGNRAAEEITGYKRDELIGKSFLKLKLLPAGQIPKAAALLAKNILGQSTGPDEFTLNRKDGTKVQVEISSYPTKIAGKTLVLSVARDITQRKKGGGEKGAGAESSACQPPGYSRRDGIRRCPRDKQSPYRRYRLLPVAGTEGGYA